VGYETKMKPEDQELIQKIENVFKRSGFAPPLEEEIRLKQGVDLRHFKNMIHSLFERGVLVRLSKKVVFHRDSVESARKIVLAGKKGDRLLYSWKKRTGGLKK